ncbi:MAG TPA: hydroxymethylbilane synthase [Solirubrobacteraceae bacterium]|nr:hydroxymethylbilane synthase [Solirubrobacteraceae bacterium]
MRIGTRGSALALAQARPIADALGGELVVIATSGDRDATASDKSRWVAEIERALLHDDVDLAVHSAKDVPSELADGLTLLPSPPRADPRDALCGAPSLAALGHGARVGTSSLRRAAQLRAARPDLEVAELRGNVDTRLRRLREGGYDAIVLAAAGLARLGRASEGHPLDGLLPAAGQGTLALEARADRDDVREAAAALADEHATGALAAERALVRGLEADCHTPVAAFAARAGALWRLEAFVGRVDGSAWLRDDLHGADPEALGAEVARRLLTAGAAEVLGR